jgi:hypothetical protein
MLAETQATGDSSALDAMKSYREDFRFWLARRCAPSAVPLVDDVVETSEMVRQNGKELSYPRHRQGQVCVDVYGRCCGSTGANKLASLGRSSTRFNLDKAWDRWCNSDGEELQS